MKKKLKWIVIAIVGIFIFFVIIGLLSDEGKKGFEQGKQDAKEVVEPQTQSFSESELSETTIRSEIGTLKGSLRALNKSRDYRLRRNRGCFG